MIELSQLEGRALKWHWQLPYFEQKVGYFGVFFKISTSNFTVNPRRNKLEVDILKNDIKITNFQLKIGEGQLPL